MFSKRSSAVLHLSSVFLSGVLTGLASASDESSESLIQWQDCPDTWFSPNLPPIPMQCSNITVPLDYTDPDSNATIELPIARVPALKQPSKGSIIIHFGGPAPLQRTTLVNSEPLLLLSGQGFDLVTWDQRGTGETVPLNCFNSSEERALFQAFKSNFAVTPEDKVEFGRMWALNEKEAQICHDYAIDKDADKVGTVDTVRDVMQIVDALGGDRKARFWGISYGTIVGATLAAIFPERVERLVLDGVSNPHQWYSGQFWEMQHDSDKVLSGFLRACFEKPDRCALAAAYPNSTAEEIEEILYEKFDELKYHPVPLLNTTVPGSYLLDHGGVKTMIRRFLYYPVLYPALGTVIQLLLAKDVEALAKLWSDTSPVTDVGDGSIGITCSDSNFRTDKVEDVLPIIEKSMELSRFLGDWSAVNIALCAQWKLPLKERFTRGFHEPINLQTPPLLFGNEYDIVTPHVSAVNASASFPGSSVVRFNAFGHGIMNHPSVCTANLLRQYLENGTLPAPDTVCEAAAHPLEDVTWDPLFEELDYVRPSNDSVSNSTTGA